MKCEIIAVGTELLLGNIVNTNAQFLSQRLADLGVDVYYHLAVGDNLARISEMVKQSLERSDIVITSGGLGPTDDDITKEAVCDALQLKLLPNEEIITEIEQFFKKINRPMPECNKKQGFIPEGAQILFNNNGTAPGVLIEKNQKTIILLPGPPKELIPLFEEYVSPYIKSKVNCVIRSKMLRIVGVGESTVQEMLKDIFDKQTNPTIAPYAKDGEVHLRITAKCDKEEEADKLISDMEKTVHEILKENIYGYDDETLESVVVKLLKEKKVTISLAESCTGGLISNRITDVPGASVCFMNSVVSYSNESKQKFLHVKEKTLKNYGAVSGETAAEMADGIRKVSGTDMGLSVTGIAGPDGGSKEKPVGLFYIGISYKDRTETYRYQFLGNRKKIKLTASYKALDLIRRTLLK